MRIARSPRSPRRRSCNANYSATFLKSLLLCSDGILDGMAFLQRFHGCQCFGLWDLKDTLLMEGDSQVSRLFFGRDSDASYCDVQWPYFFYCRRGRQVSAIHWIPMVSGYSARVLMNIASGVGILTLKSRPKTNLSPQCLLMASSISFKVTLIFSASTFGWMNRL